MGRLCYNRCMNLPKALFFDVDGTLLDTNTHKVPQSTVNALNALADQGYLICIATGRNMDMVQELNLKGLVKWKFLICGNGHVILDEQFKIIRHHFVSSSSVKALIERATAMNMPVFLAGPDGDMMSMPPNAYVEISHRFYKEPIPKVKAYEGERIDKIVLYEKEDFDWSVFSDLSELEVKPTMTTSADVMEAGISKHSSILDVLKTHGYPDYYIAFGDSMNDMEMLRHAPISVAMGNAIDDIKKIAHYVADDVDKDGIAKMLKQLGYCID